MTTVNIFERATRIKLRFASVKGSLSVEELWELPLASKVGQPNLDTLAIDVHRQLKAMAEESFVADSRNSNKAPLELQLDVLKHIIAVKIQERDDKQSAAQRAEQRQRLTAALERKQDQALEGMSVEDIQKQLAALGG